jgi:hypothetical protein
MKTAVIGSAAAGFSVIKVEGFGRIDSGFPTFFGSKIATGFATFAEAKAWAKQWEEEQA